MTGRIVKRRVEQTAVPSVKPDPNTPVEALGQQLRAMFDQVAAQPLPEPIHDLVEALDKRHDATGSKLN